MNNPRLNKFSVAQAGYGDEFMEERCFLLFAGTDVDNGSALSIDADVIKFDNPKKSTVVNCDITIDNFMLEQCSDVILSLTHLVPDFKTVLRFGDLKPKPSNVNLERYICHWAPIMYLRRNLIRKPYTDL